MSAVPIVIAAGTGLALLLGLTTGASAQRPRPRPPGPRPPGPRPPMPRPPTPEPQPGSTAAAKKAARALYSYVSQMLDANRGAQLGTRGKPNRKIKAWQAAMLKIDDDGVYGPETRKRGKALIGRTFPVRKKKFGHAVKLKPLAKPGKPPKPGKPRPLPEHKVKLGKPKPKPKRKPRPRKPPPAPPAPEPPAPTLSPVEAAERLYSYVVMMLRDDRGAELGTRGKPNATIKKWQKAMKRIDDDGVYGGETRARGKELLGRSFPERKRRAPAPAPAAPPAPEPEEAPAVEPAPLLVSTAPPAPPQPEPEEAEPEPQRTPVQAAQDLYDYARRAPKRKGRAAWFGYKNNPNETVRAAQADMNIEPDDGIYGPATRRKGKTLISKTYPAR